MKYTSPKKIISRRMSDCSCLGESIGESLLCRGAYVVERLGRDCLQQMQLRPLSWRDRQSDKRRVKTKEDFQGGGTASPLRCAGPKTMRDPSAGDQLDAPVLASPAGVVPVDGLGVSPPEAA